MRFFVEDSLLHFEDLLIFSALLVRRQLLSNPSASHLLHCLHLLQLLLLSRFALGNILQPLLFTVVTRHKLVGITQQVAVHTRAEGLTFTLHNFLTDFVALTSPQTAGARQRGYTARTASFQATLDYPDLESMDLRPTAPVSARFDRT